MKRPRSFIEAITVEDAICALLAEADPIIGAEQVIGNETLSSDFSTEDRIAGLNHLVEQVSASSSRAPTCIVIIFFCCSFFSDVNHSVK